MMSQQILPTAKNLIGDGVLITKVDTEKYPSVASRFNISALPTLVLFKDGQEVDRIEGVVPAPQLASRVKQFL